MVPDELRRGGVAVDDRPVAAAALGFVERAVGAGDELLRRLDAVPRRRAGREGLADRRGEAEALEDRDRLRRLRGR
jgi:hypothetical protein